MQKHLLNKSSRLHNIFIRNGFTRDLVLDILKFKKLLEQQGKR